MTNKDDGKRPSIKIQEELPWINIDYVKFEKNFTRYMMMKLKEQSEFNKEEFLYWNEEWNSNENK